MKPSATRSLELRSHAAFVLVAHASPSGDVCPCDLCARAARALGAPRPDPNGWRLAAFPTATAACSCSACGSTIAVGDRFYTYAKPSTKLGGRRPRRHLCARCHSAAKPIR